VYKPLTALHTAAHALHVHHQQQQQPLRTASVRADTVLLPAVALALATSTPIAVALRHSSSTAGSYAAAGASTYILAGPHLSKAAALTLCATTAAALWYSSTSVLRPLLILFGCNGSVLQLVLLVFTLLPAHTFALASVCNPSNLRCKQLSAAVVLVCVLLGLLQVSPTSMHIYLWWCQRLLLVWLDCDSTAHTHTVCRCAHTIALVAGHVISSC
jgi:hypothetical protein